MELLQLQYFQEVARSGHLSRSAEKLHIAQPSLSQTLKRLETEVGTPLFDRVGRGIVLNESGKIFLKHVDDIFASLNNAALEIKTSENRLSKTVSLYIGSASMFLPEIVKRIQQEDKEIRLQISQHLPGEDPSVPSLLLTSSPVRPQQSGATSILLKEKIKLALPKNHPLASQTELRWKQVEEESFLSLPPNSDLSKEIQYFCQAKDANPTITTYVDSPSMMRELLRLHLGLAFVPEITWKDFGSGNVVLKSIADLPMERYVQLSWKEDQYQTPAVMLCKEIIQQCIKEYSSQRQ